MDTLRTGYLGNYAFDYYMQKNGFSRFDEENHKFLVLARYGSVHFIYGGNPVIAKLGAKLKLMNEIPKDAGFPLRIWDPTAFAGFHLNMFGYIPWGLSRAPMEEF